MRHTEEIPYLIKGKKLYVQTFRGEGKVWRCATEIPWRRLTDYQKASLRECARMDSEEVDNE